MITLSKKNQLRCIWSAAIGMAFIGIGFFPLAHFLPPHSPAASAQEIADIYQQNTFGIRLGMIAMQIGSAMIFPLLGVISIQMKRIDGATLVLAYTQMLAGIINFFFFLLPPLIWTVAAFRPERSPEITQLMNDFAWIAFVMTVAPAAAQNISIGVATLQDSRPASVFPRWLAFFNFLLSILYIADLLVTFFKNGPFAYNGAISFYLPLVCFSSWLIVMMVCSHKAVRQQE